MASVLQEYGSRIGLNLAVNRVPADGYWSTHWMKHPMGFGNTNPRPTADLMFSLFYKSDAAWNESGWKNPRFDRLLVEARGEANQAKRKQLYGEMQELVRDYCGVSIPVFINLIDAQRTLLEFRLAEVEARIKRELALADLSLQVMGVPPSGAPFLDPSGR